MLNKKKIQKLERGITLIEIIFVIFMIALFSVVLVADFPRIQRQLALSRSTYKMAQNLRKTQDLGLSGVKIVDIFGQDIAVRGYGIFFDLINSPDEYIIYADIYDPETPENNYKFSGSGPYELNFCVDKNRPRSDCVMDIINIKEENRNLVIKDIINISGQSTSINFRPPDPTVDIDNLAPGESEVGIEFGLGENNAAAKRVWINTSGLIKIE